MVPPRRSLSISDNGGKRRNSTVFDIECIAPSLKKPVWVRPQRTSEPRPSSSISARVFRSDSSST